MNIENKVALITGGASGLGLATAKICLSRGAYVYLCDLNKQYLKKINKHKLINKK